MVRSRPILFSGPMVRALLSGAKTQTRRIVKLEPWMIKAGMDLEGASTDNGFFGDSFEYLKIEKRDDGTRHRLTSPYGNVGDTLWVRESIRHIGDGGSEYVADGEWTKGDAWPWKNNTLPSIHCPRGLSRITLEIIETRVHRLQFINGHDVLAEGVDNGKSNPAMGVRWENMQQMAFADLWSSINGEESWLLNPWVWAVTFRRIKPEKNQ